MNQLEEMTVFAWGEQILLTNSNLGKWSQFNGTAVIAASIAFTCITVATSSYLLYKKNKSNQSQQPIKLDQITLPDTSESEITQPETTQSETSLLETTQPQTSFPELEGKDIEYAIKYMKETHPHLKSFLIHKDSPRISDLRRDRVWLDYDSDNKIFGIPEVA